MSKNSNQSGALILTAIVLGAVIYAFIFFGSSMEQTNVSASFGQLSKSKSVNLFSNNNATVFSNLQVKELPSDLSGNALPSHKMRSTSGGDYAQTSNLDFPTTGISQMDLQNSNASTASSQTTSKTNYANNLSPTYAIGNATVEYISNPQNPTKSDINVLLLLDTRAAESAISAQQGSKRATSALAAKTASVSISLSENKSAKKVIINPSEPGSGASLPVGDGVWMMLALAGMFASHRFIYGLKH